MSEIMDKIKEFIDGCEKKPYSIAIMGDDIEPEHVHFILANRCQNVYSVAKSFVVTAAGIAWDRGLLKLDGKVTDILASYLPAGMDERWHNVTVEDALKHRIGLSRGFLDIDVNRAGAFGSDYLGFMLTAPFEINPCETGIYTDAAYYLMSRVVEQAVGEPIDSFLWREMFQPLNFVEMAWSRCPQGHPMGATGLYIAVEDMVKNGEVYRRGGEVDGKRIVSKEWTELVLSKHFEFSYRESINGYGKGGMNGQDLCILPDRRMSVAYQSYRFDRKDELLQFIAGL